VPPPTEQKISASFERKQRKRELLKNVEALKKELPELAGKREFPTASEKAGEWPDSPKVKPAGHPDPALDAYKAVHTPNGGKYILLPVPMPSKVDVPLTRETSRQPKIDTTSIENYTKNHKRLDWEVTTSRQVDPGHTISSSSQALPEKQRKEKSKPRKVPAPALPETKSPFSDKQISPVSFANSNRFSVESNLKSALDKLSINFSATKNPERDAHRMQRRLDIAKVNWDLTPSSKHIEAKKLLDEEITKLASERQRKNSSKIKGGRPRVKDPPSEAVPAEAASEYFNGISSTHLWDNQESRGFKWILRPHFKQVIKKASVAMRITCKMDGEGLVLGNIGASSREIGQRMLRAGDTIELTKGAYFGLENQSGEEVEFECVAFK
jgi:hypothetical protein